MQEITEVMLRILIKELQFFNNIKDIANEVRLSITTIPDEQKMFTYLNVSNFAKDSHTASFTVNDASKVERIIVVFRDSRPLYERSILASCCIDISKTFNDINNLLTTDVTKTVAILEPLQHCRKKSMSSGCKNSRIERVAVGSMTIVFSLSNYTNILLNSKNIKKYKKYDKFKNVKKDKSIYNKLL